MKSAKILLVAIFCASLFYSPVKALANPLDLSGFTTMTSEASSVIESSGQINFYENDMDVAIYFYNDSFLVPLNATQLSFNYDFTLGPDDADDYLAFSLNYFSLLTQFADVTEGYFELDLYLLRGQKISLDWGLIWGGDNSAGSSARIYNIDMSFEPISAVPEPATILLLITSIAGLFCFNNRNHLMKFV